MYGSRSRQMALESSLAGLDVPEVVSTKPEMFKLLRAGVFGNKLRVFRSLKDAKDSDATLFGMRTTRIGFAKIQTGLPNRELDMRYKSMLSDGLRPDEIIIDEANDPDKVTGNFEAMLTTCGIALTYSFKRLRMRPAIAAGMEFATGLRARSILEEKLSPNSLDNLNYLFDRWPDHAIEFTSHSVNLGSIPGNNTVFWEVRTY